MLKNKWLFLVDELQPVLPNLKKKTVNQKDLAFDQLDSLVERLDAWFMNVGLHRKGSEDYKRAPELLDRFDLDEFYRVHLEFYDLCTYVGLLKYLFFQRTVSLEIPQLEAAEPRSPERTIGNEMFYVTADKMAKKYAQCIRAPYISWDQFITFIPAIAEDFFYGAFFRPTPGLKLFHVSMSEEQKYFLGSYLTLAHEFGHAAIAGSSRSIIPRWLKYFHDFCFHNTIRFQKKNYSSKCRDCEIAFPRLLRARTKRVTLPFFYDMLENFVADIIAFRIGGINTAQVLLDFAPVVAIDECIIRMYGLLSYLYSKKFDSKIIFPLLNKLEALLQSTRLNKPKSVKFTTCFDCWQNIGKLWGRCVRVFFERDVRDPLAQTILREFDHRFKKVDKTQVEQALIEGRPVTDIDPRLILHVYYDLFSENIRPNYSATLYSIVYNKH